MWPRGYLVVLTLVGGTAVLMWIGELISQRGIGNGMSMVIFASVVSRLPYGYYSIFKEKSWVPFVLLLAVSTGIIIAVVRVELGQRKIPVQFAKRVVGRRMYGGQSTYIPLKVNQSGVIPVIFASSILSFPALIATATNWGWLQDFANKYLVKQDSFFYMGLYTLLIIFFAYFYTAIAFNPVDTADSLRKYGGFVPGIRPGQPTADYLNNVLVRITLPGSLFLALIAVTIVIYAGVMMIVTLGNEEQYGKSRGLIGRALVGLFVIMISYAAVTFVITLV